MKFYDALTDFIFTEQKPEKADAIFVPGGLYGEIAQHAAELYQQGFASLVVPSGKYSIVEGKFTKVQSPEKYKGRYFETESDFLTQILVDEGVKKSDILQEKEASYTYQNALFTKDLLDKKGLHLKNVILSCQAYHARRCLMYYQFVFPEIEFIVSPVITRGVSKENWYQSEYGICLVLKEVEHCGSQFADMMLRPCLCPINVGRDDKDCMQSVTEI